jgi:hypothetical protein
MPKRKHQNERKFHKLLLMPCEEIALYLHPLEKSNMAQTCVQMHDMWIGLFAADVMLQLPMLRRLPARFLQTKASKLSLNLVKHLHVLKEKKIEPLLAGKVFKHLVVDERYEWNYPFVADKITFCKFPKRFVPVACLSLEICSSKRDLHFLENCWETLTQFGDLAPLFNLRELHVREFCLTITQLTDFKALEVLAVHTISGSTTVSNLPHTLTTLHCKQFCYNRYDILPIKLHEGIIDLQSLDWPPLGDLPRSLTSLEVYRLSTTDVQLPSLTSLSLLSPCETVDLKVLPRNLVHLKIPNCCLDDTILNHFSTLQTLHVLSVTTKQNVFLHFPLLQRFVIERNFTRCVPWYYPQRGIWYHTQKKQDWSPWIWNKTKFMNMNVQGMDQHDFVS